MNSVLQRDKRIRLALAIGPDWGNGCSGVSTFLKTVLPEWSLAYDCIFVGCPQEQYQCADMDRQGEEQAAPVIVRRAPSTISLSLGYARELLQQMTHVASVRNQLRDRLVIVNEFGCELLPIAYRLCSPGSPVLAIAHTHPGQDVAAQHPVRRWVERACYKSVQHLIFNSSGLKEEWRRKLGTPDIRGRVILHGIDADTLGVPDDYPKKTPGTVDFVYLAQFYEWKGQLEFLSTWQEACLRATTPMRLILIGDGVALPACQEYAEQHGLGDSVIFLGERRNGAEYLNGADVLVHVPPEPEAFGLVLLEAMAAQLPIVASNLGGIPEIVVNGETGLLVNPHRQNEILEAVQQLASNGLLRNRLAKNGYQRWHDVFTKERMLREYDGVFQSICTENPESVNHCRFA